MYGYIYLTTNLVNGKKYVGQKKSEVFCEWYLGSGKILKQAIDKYGRENFKVEVLKWCNSKEELDQAEINEIADRSAAKSFDYYNIAIGGKTLVHYLTEEQRLEMSKRQKLILNKLEVRKKMSESQKGHKPTKGFTGRQHTEETRQKMHDTHHTRKRVITEEWRKSISENHADMHGENNPMYGRIQSDSTKELIGKKASKRMLGGKWMNKDGICSFVYLEKQQEYLDNGFVFGRLPLGKHKKKN